jgi:hypothetical protein
LKVVSLHVLGTNVTMEEDEEVIAEDTTGRSDSEEGNGEKEATAVIKQDKIVGGAAGDDDAKEDEAEGDSPSADKPAKDSEEEGSVVEIAKPEPKGECFGVERSECSQANIYNRSSSDQQEKGCVPLLLELWLRALLNAT